MPPLTSRRQKLVRKLTPPPACYPSALPRSDDDDDDPPKLTCESASTQGGGGGNALCCATGSALVTDVEPGAPTSVSGPRGSFGDGRAMRTAVASKFRQSAGDGTLRIGEMRGSHPCAWHSAAATCGAAVALSALASLLGDWGRSPQQAGACLTLWNEVPEENWPFLLKILAMSVMGAGDALAMSPPPPALI